MYLIDYNSTAFLPDQQRPPFWEFIDEMLDKLRQKWQMDGKSMYCIFSLICTQINYSCIELSRRTSMTTRRSSRPEHQACPLSQKLSIYPGGKPMSAWRLWPWLNTQPTHHKTTMDTSPSVRSCSTTWFLPSHMQTLVDTDRMEGSKVLE